MARRPVSLRRCGAAWRRQIERQERHQPLQPVVHHQRRRVGQDVLHRLEVHAPQRHVLRRLIGRQHREEALRLPGRLGDRGQPGALPFRHDACRITAGARHDVVAIGFGLVAQAFGVGVGALHVDEAFHHLGRRIDLLQLHLGDLDAGLVVVEDLLRLVQHVVLDLRAQFGQRRLDRGAPDHLAHRAFRHRLDDQGRVARVEQVADRVADLPEHREVDVDDVLIAGEHQALFQHVASALVAGRRSAGCCAGDSRSRCG